jgi:hypothetical protein
MQPKLNKRKCKICKSIFQKERPLQFVCSLNCGIQYANNKDIALKRTAMRLERAKIKKSIESIKTKSERLKDAQRIFNMYIRLRDEHLPCISCQRFHTGQYHAGHYRTVGAAPGLRFNESNVHKQCSACNNHLSGNIVNYRINLIRKIGHAAVDALESDNTAKHYTNDDIEQIKIKYKQLIKELKDASLST